MNDVIELTQQLIQIDSCNPGKQEKEISDFIFNWLLQIGAFPEKLEVLPDRYNIRASTHPHKNSPSLVYICHMDTVPVGENWSQNPFGGQIHGNKLYGRGACDMKSGLACAMMVFKQMWKLADSLQYPFTFIATVDEEADMLGAEALIQAGWVTKDDWILDAEPTGGKIRSGHKGRAWFRLHTEGQIAHASTPEKGADAIAAMAAGIAEIYQQVASLPAHPFFGKTTAVFGTVTGGLEEYVVPEHCTATLDMRLVPPISTDKSIQIINSALAKGVSQVRGVKSHVEVVALKPYINFYPESFLLTEAKKAFEQVNGQAPIIDIFTGYTDSAVVAARTGCANCISYGPGDLSQAHTADEFVLCDSINQAYKVLLQLAKQMCSPN